MSQNTIIYLTYNECVPYRFKKWNDYLSHMQWDDPCFLESVLEPPNN